MSTQSSWGHYAARTSGTLAVGVVLLVVGVVLIDYAHQERLVAVMQGGDTSWGLGWLGIVIGVFGLGSVLIGVHDFAANVDIIAERAGYELAVARSGVPTSVVAPSDEAPSSEVISTDVSSASETAPG